MSTDRRFKLRFPIASPEAAPAADVARVILELSHLFDASAAELGVHADLRLHAVRKGSLQLLCEPSNIAGAPVATRVKEVVANGGSSATRAEREAYAKLWSACSAIAVPFFRADGRPVKFEAPALAYTIEADATMYGRVCGIWERAGGLGVEIATDGGKKYPLEALGELADRAQGLFRKTVRADVLFDLESGKRTHGRLRHIDPFAEADPVALFEEIRQALAEKGSLLDYDEFVRDLE